MRLVCPNCEAKYEVPDDAIPDSGRDVQCANCGHAWFQMRSRPAAVAEPVAPPPPVAEPEVVPEVVAAPEVSVAAEAAPDLPEPEAEPEPMPDPVPEPAPDPVPEPAPEPAPVEVPAELPEEAPVEPPLEEPMPAPVEGPEAEPLEDSAPDTAEAAPASEPAVAAYKVDESVLAILREEAEREARVRRAEAGFPETQAELGVDAAMPAPAAVAAAVVEAAAVPTAVEDSRPSARRDLLPDVEEINSSLRPSDHPQGDDESAGQMPPPAAEGRGGFRSGFLIVMTLAMIGSGLYIASPTLVRLVPSLEGPLDSYVALVNSLRLQLDGVMRQATVALNGG